MAKGKGKKKKKDRITYYDDGSTVSDMSAITGTGKGRNLNIDDDGSFKARFKTYTKAVKKMFVPMLVTMGAICIVFLLLYLIFELAA